MVLRRSLPQRVQHRKRGPRTGKRRLIRHRMSRRNNTELSRAYPPAAPRGSALLQFGTRPAPQPRQQRVEHCGQRPCPQRRRARRRSPVERNRSPPSTNSHVPRRINNYAQLAVEGTLDAALIQHLLEESARNLFENLPRLRSFGHLGEGVRPFGDERDARAPAGRPSSSAATAWFTSL